MKPARSFLSLLLVSGLCSGLSSSLAAQAARSPEPVLDIVLKPGVAEFHVGGPKGVFLGGVILSLSPDLVHYFQGLPPLLAEFVVLGVGAAHGEYVVSVPQIALPPGIRIYAQGVVADLDIQSTAVGSLVLDAKGPKQ